MARALWLDLDSRGNLDDGHACDAATLARRSGMNLGNLVFRRALLNIVAMDDADAVDYTGALAACAQSRPSRLIVSAANWLAEGPNAERDNEFRRRLFDSANCPIAVFGLGVQAARGSRPHLGPHTRALVRLLGERAALVGVRDTLTGETLSAIGVDNAVVAGCPSNFLCLDPALGQRVQARAARLPALPFARLRLQITEASGGHPASMAVRAANLALLRDTSSLHVVQSPALLPFALGETPRLPDDYAAHAAAMGLGADALARCVRDRTLHFSSVDAWMDFARTCDLSVGMRIHGAMVALQAGIPALLVAHDSRTTGLGRTMGVPSITPESFLNLVARRFDGVEALVRAGYERYDTVRRELGLRTLDLVRRNGLVPTPAFDRFCASIRGPAGGEAGVTRSPVEAAAA